MEYTLTHQKTELSQILPENNWYGVPNKHFPNTNGPRCQTNVRTNKNAQIALGAQNRTRPRCTPGHLLRLGACQLVQMHVPVPPRKSVRWQPVPSRGETGRIPKTNGFGSCEEHPPRASSQGHLATNSWLIAAILARCRGRELYSRKPHAVRSRENAAPRWAPKHCYWKRRSGCSPLKS